MDKVLEMREMVRNLSLSDLFLLAGTTDAVEAGAMFSKMALLYPYGSLIGSRYRLMYMRVRVLSGTYSRVNPIGNVVLVATL